MLSVYNKLNTCNHELSCSVLNENLVIKSKLPRDVSKRFVLDVLEADLSRKR